MRIIISENQLQFITEMSVKAYHGTPHSFDKFDTRKVGSGESTQWFGWGIYLTDSEDIADWYSKSVSKSINDTTIDNSPIKYGYNYNIKGSHELNDVIFGKKDFFGDKFLRDIIGEIFDDIVMYVKGKKKWEDIKYIGDRESVIKHFKNSWESYFSFESERISNKKPGDFMYDELHNRLNWYKKEYQNFLEGKNVETNEAINKIVNLSPGDFELRDKSKLFKSSNLYSVTVHPNKTPDEYDYISWYDGLSESQKRKIINQLKTEKLKKKIFYIVKPQNDEVEVQPRFYLKLEDAKKYAKNWNYKNTIFGGIGLNQVEVVKGTFTMSDLNGKVKDFYTQLSGLLGSPKEASMFLLRAGIDGIKYPSNTVAGGESKGLNYVIFDDNSINIDKRDERDL